MNTARSNWPSVTLVSKPNVAVKEVVTEIHDARSRIVAAHARFAMTHLAAAVAAYEREAFDQAEDALLDAKRRISEVQDAIDDAIRASDRPELERCRDCGERGCAGHDQDIGF